jgi:hypothetical protein
MLDTTQEKLANIFTRLDAIRSEVDELTETEREKGGEDWELFEELSDILQGLPAIFESDEDF